MNSVSVALPTELIYEMLLRAGRDVDLGDWIANVVRDYLDRTVNDGPWREEFYAYREQSADDEATRAQYGDPKDGYQWGPLFLPNRTRLRMEYKKEMHDAEVRHGKIIFKERAYSPSELARTIANNTNRNAWRDLMIFRPSDSAWALADDARARGGK